MEHVAQRVILAGVGVICLAAPSVLLGQSAAPGSPDPGREVWMRRIEPTPVELSWERIPWQATFGDGLLVANQKRRPLILYAMNGHPLGNT